MKLEEYLTTVTEQIRCQKARELVSDELKDHILDQAEAYEAEGMFEEEALEKAVREMGDPVETGVSLDRVHRPQMEAEILAVAGIIGILSILLHGALGFYSPDLYGTGGGYLKSHIAYTVCGYALMLFVYRVDYSVLARYGRQIAAGFLVFMIAGGMFFGQTVNGMLLYINLGGIHLSIPMLMYLYIPLYAGVLYQYRGEGYKAFVKIFFWSVIPMVIESRIPSLNLRIVLYLSFAILFSIAVWKNWYQVNRKKVLAVLWMTVLIGPAFLVGFLYATRRMAYYQMVRIHAFLTQSGDANYQAGVAAKCLKSSSLLGSNEVGMMEAVQLPGFNNDYIFVSLVSVYGILAGVLAVALLLFLLVKIFRVSLCQRNQLGMILGCACGSVFMLQLVMSLGVNLGLLPTTSTVLPFFSSGGTGIVVSYILLGLVLSVYRYKNILAEKPKKKAAGIAL